MTTLHDGHQSCPCQGTEELVHVERLPGQWVSVVQQVGQDGDQVSGVAGDQVVACCGGKVRVAGRYLVSASLVLVV